MRTLPLPENFSRLRRAGVAPISLADIEITLREGSELSALHDSTGDFSLVLSYKKRVGAIMSIGVETAPDGIEQWTVLQLQGARKRQGGKGFRVFQGLLVPELFAEIVQGLVNEQQQAICLTMMRSMHGIAGLEDEIANESSHRFDRITGHYRSFANAIGMKVDQTSGQIQATLAPISW